MDTLGIYISVPFCRAKCSYCNFASGVFSRDRMAGYVDRVCSDLRRSPAHVQETGAQLPREVDTIYFGGGTPSLLPVELIDACLAAARASFSIAPDAEITMECAPGQIPDALPANFAAWKINRVSLGVQSFIDTEAKVVGRLHTRQQVLADIQRLRDAGIHNISIDLIAGLPQQTPASWLESLDALLDTAVPHASIYMLEIDEDSRLGQEVIAGGVRYHAHEVPPEDQAADSYIAACERLKQQGIAQYEISNFARSGFESRHNNKYWSRQPYLGVGLDAHSMLITNAPAAVRFSATGVMDTFLAGPSRADITLVGRNEALEEEWFLGLRMVRGISLTELAAKYGAGEIARFQPIIAEAIMEGLLDRAGDRIRLTQRGRLLSNLVFERFIGEPVPA